MKIFDQVQFSRVRKSKFDLSHEKKFSFQMGELVPTLVQEIVPGDMFRVKSEIFLRLQALLSPVMHRVDVTTHYFFVPNRLIWDSWEDFITGGRTGTINPIWPYITVNASTQPNLGVGTLADYLGVPQSLGTGAFSIDISALPFRAYQLIYDEYYRDNTITPPIDCPITSGNQTANLTAHATLRKRAWEKDYFTTARPSTQLGTEVSLPAVNSVTYLPQSKVKTVAGVNANANSLVGVDSVAGDMTVNKSTNNTAGAAGRIENIDQVTTNITINNLRRALKLQEWLEKNMRAGSRYVEQILSHFGVKSPDARLQRPEYLGGGKQPVTISEVLQTAQGTNPVGTMNGHAYSIGTSNQFSKMFTEHGFVIGITSVLPKTAYMNGINKMWSRPDRFDYYFPEFANIGEQAVLNKEVYATTNVPASVNDGVFGYQQRYAEYKYTPSTVHGELATSLDYWHMARKFTTTPLLNTSFVEADPTQRVFAIVDPNVDKLIAQIYHKVDAIRPMPWLSQPSI